MKLSKATSGLLLSVTILSIFSTSTSAFATETVTAAEGQNKVYSSSDNQENETRSEKDASFSEGLLKKYYTPEQIKQIKNLGNTEASYLKSKEAKAKTLTASQKISSLQWYYSGGGDTGVKTTFNTSSNQDNPYKGKMNVDVNVKSGGRLQGSNLILNTPEFIKDYENGNYGGMGYIVLPEGVDAKAFAKTIDWSTASITDKFDMRIIGIDTLVYHLDFPAKIDQSTVKFPKSNVISFIGRGQKKSEMSEAEWNSHNPATVYAALAAAGAGPNYLLGDMKGNVHVSFTADMSKYTGNTDDFSSNKEVTAGQLPPAKSRHFEPKSYAHDFGDMTAGPEGTDISGATITPGKELNNLLPTKASVDTWDSYLSIRDSKDVYNTAIPANPEVIGENTVLPGNSIFNRDLTVKNGDNFNKFSNNRFNRVVNYFDKKDVTNGDYEDISDISITHNPTFVTTDAKTPVKYTGSISYTNGDVRQFVPNTLNVTNKPATKGSIIPNEYKLGERNITGTYTDDVAQARLFINGTQVSKGGTFTNGKFTYYVGEKTLSATDKVTMNAYDKDGNLLQENVPVVIDQTPDTKGTIIPNDYTVGNTNITGSYTGDVAKARVTVNGVTQSLGGSFANGQFSYYIGAGKIKVGDTVTITAYDKDSKVLDTKTVTVKAQNTKGTITPSTYKVGDTDITGSYTGDVAKARLAINGKMQAWGGTFTNGKFDYYIGAGKIKSGDKVTITAYDKDGKILDQDKKVTVEGDESKGTIKANKYTIGDTQITGTYTGKVAKAQISINGKVQAYGGDFTNGQFKYYVGAGKIKAGDTVTITAYDADDKVLDKAEPVTIAEAAGTLTPDTYYLGQTTVKGSYTGNIVRARLLINGTAQAWGGTFSDGSFSYYIGSGKIKKGDTVRIAGYDSNDNEVTTVPVNVTE
ncbi:hypothetical protein GKC32_06195 [Lactobacillus curvatus]|nr:hypothetical protein [Latilactobacillus curvatus]MSE24059.1 hypothetical protein [Latilactobacillus curvatus]